MGSAVLQYESVGDIVAVDRRADIRVITSIPGRYSLGSRHDGRGNRREFACRALNVSTRAMLLAAPVSGPPGERVVAFFDRFGQMEGNIIRVLMRGGFVMSIAATEDERARFAAKLAWLEDHKNHDAHEARKHERIVPRDPYSTLTLADGRMLTCLVIDMSASGVAVSAEVVPKIGTPVAVGTVIGRVRRHFAEGFAVEFIEVQNIDMLPHRLLRR
jgi:hypothetical protein